MMTGGLTDRPTNKPRSYPKPRKQTGKSTQQLNTSFRFGIVGLPGRGPHAGPGAGAGSHSALDRRRGDGGVDGVVDDVLNGARESVFP